MNKILLKIFGILLISNISFTQVNYTGNIIIDPYYGFPNFGKSLTMQTTSYLNFKSSGFGPAGCRGEYILAEKIGLGFDFIYNSNKVSYKTSDTLYSLDAFNNILTDVQSSSYERLMRRVRFQARINFHFNLSTPNLDGYFGVGIGTNNRFRKYWIDGKETTDINNIVDELGNYTFFPFSMRVCTGFRYYFNPKIGANMEIVLGGPLFSAGVSVKIK